nr:glycosyltransferase family 2 protein [Treponema sp.]
MEKKYTFSIIIPLYNSEKYIKRCLLSVINQNFDDYECIIVDDGSTDNTKELVEQFAAEGCMEIRYCYKANGGKVSAINHSLDITDTPLWVCL